MESCFLCGEKADTPQGILYHRFFDPVTERWVSEAICEVCWLKLKGA